MDQLGKHKRKKKRRAQHKRQRHGESRREERKRNRGSDLSSRESIEFGLGTEKGEGK
jgi:hypothetical protein